MSDIRIEALSKDHSKDYSNDDAYERVLGYISQKKYIGGFGFTCSPELSIIRQFQLSQECSLYSAERKMWHFIITFASAWPHLSLLQLASVVAKAFSPEYQILFGVDTEGGSNPHLHFGVNAFSYHPEHPVLSEELMHDYLKQLQIFLQNHYPTMTITLQFLGKGERDV